MLALLGRRMSARKLRLFACACCQRIRSLLRHKQSRSAVRVAERYADGLATQHDLAEAYAQSYNANYFSSSTAHTAAGGAASHAASYPLDPGLVAEQAAVARARADCGDSHTDQLEEALLDEGRTQSALLRCIFGPRPFHRVEVEAVAMAWNGGAVSKLAQGIYEDRDFDRLPILADALEEGGCANQDILLHCRHPAEHVRGCWVIDLLLGKE
jgi:hypothetical protein